MDNVATPDDDIVDRAERALRAFEGRPLYRGQAARLLVMWTHASELTDAQRTTVLRRFPTRTHGWSIDRDEPGGRFVYICTCGHTVTQAFGVAVPDELISHPREHGQMRGEQ